MMTADMTVLEKQKEALRKFRAEFPQYFEKDDKQLWAHLGIVLGLLAVSTFWIVTTPWIGLKIILGVINAFFYFSLINVTIHHHHTHHNAARGKWADWFLSALYLLVLPNAPKRKGRYVKAHLNHHARPFHESDLDHHHGTERYLRMMKNVRQRILYFLELTFVGAHMPGWEDDRYMMNVPMDQWSREDYQEVKRLEKRQAISLSLLQWGAFFVMLWIFPPLAWGWIFPMLLVKNWAHFLGQFQHYDEGLLEDSRSLWQRTRTFRFPGWLNYLAGGEISGHFLHHLFPQMPYYHVETARRKMLQDPVLRELFVVYSTKKGQAVRPSC